MTREEAIKTLRGEAWICCSEKWNEALDMAIKALSSSEKPNKWIRAEVLYKIRAEIESAIQEENVSDNCGAIYGDEHIESKLDPDVVFQIIDKYKAEGSEE